jgi:hypothetical protein
MTGLLLGILLSRVAAAWWPSTSAGAPSTAGGGASCRSAWQPGAACRASWRPATLGYGALMASLAAGAPARRAAPRGLGPGLLSVGFSAFWSTLAVMLHPLRAARRPAPSAWPVRPVRWPRRWPAAWPTARPRLVTRLGTGLACCRRHGLGVLLPGLAPLLVLATIGFDFGVQATLVAHQTLVYSLEPAARSRLNAVLFTGMFIGMARRCGLGSLALAQWGWLGGGAGHRRQLVPRRRQVPELPPRRSPSRRDFLLDIPTRAKRRVRRAGRLKAAEARTREQSRPERSGKGLTQRAAWRHAAFLTGEAARLRDGSRSTEGARERGTAHRVSQSQVPRTART